MDFFDDGSEWHAPFRRVGDFGPQPYDTERHASVFTCASENGAARCLTATRGVLHGHSQNYQRVYRCFIQDPDEFASGFIPSTNCGIDR